MSNIRRYVPSEIWGDRLQSDKFERYATGTDFLPAANPHYGHCHTCGFYVAYSDGINIAVDGACRDNGHPSARASYGIYFNMESRFNSAGLLDDGPMTNQRAEITAAIEACKLCHQMLVTPNFHQQIGQIVIKSDSAYVVNSMVVWVENWRENNYKSSRGSPVVNADLLQRLDIWVSLLEREGVDVRFWLVPRTQNKQADKLANAALDGEDHRLFTADDFGLMGDRVCVRP